MIGITNFEVISPDIEELAPPGLSPEETVSVIALQKATCVLNKRSAHDTIIAADTLVYLDGRPIGKPADPDDAAAMLRELSGRRHSVYTGLALLHNGEQLVATEMTNVYFRYVSDTEICDYVKTGEPMDKAGAYAAQGMGAIFVERVEGDFFNVMGLPLCRLSKMLKDFGVVTS